jgi:hypothetical protein
VDDLFGLLVTAGAYAAIFSSGQTTGTDVAACRAG